MVFRRIGAWRLLSVSLIKLQHQRSHLAHKSSQSPICKVRGRTLIRCNGNAKSRGGGIKTSRAIGHDGRASAEETGGETSVGVFEAVPGEVFDHGSHDAG